MLGPVHPFGSQLCVEGFTPLFLVQGAQIICSDAQLVRQQLQCQIRIPIAGLQRLTDVGEFGILEIAALPWYR